MVEYKLTEDELIIGCEKCKENVQNLLDGAKGLLDNENTFQFALGLYIYAVEEYGKAGLLKSHLWTKKLFGTWLDIWQGRKGSSSEKIV